MGYLSRTFRICAFIFHLSWSSFFLLSHFSSLVCFESIVRGQLSFVEALKMLSFALRSFPLFIYPFSDPLLILELIAFLFIRSYVLKSSYFPLVFYGLHFILSHFFFSS